MPGRPLRPVLFAGGIDRLFNNPYHRQQLHNLGLRPDTAIGCAMRFLFRPHQHLFQGLGDLMKEMSDPRTLKIMLQVMTCLHLATRCALCRDNLISLRSMARSADLGGSVGSAAVQIRIGDGTFGGEQCLGDVHSDILNNFHTCAQQIEDAQTGAEPLRTQEVARPVCTLQIAEGCHPSLGILAYPC